MRIKLISRVEEMSELHHEEPKRFLLSSSGFFIDQVKTNGICSHLQ